MKFMLPKELEKNYVSYPNTVALISAYDRDHVANFMSAVWQTQLSMNPLLHGVSISAKRYTHGLITESGHFSVAFYAFKDRDIYVKGGRLSGRDGDKARAAGLEVTQGRVVDVPLVRGFYAAFECELREIVSLGDHDLFVGQVKGIHLDEDAFRQDGITPLDTSPTLYLGSNRFITVDKNTLNKRTLEDIA